MRQITHEEDRDGRIVQIVTPERLREILDQDGESYEAPDHFGPGDEWQVAAVELEAA